jgi:tetratricopeptide (TPR) repeat protein
MKYILFILFAVLSLVTPLSGQTKIKPLPDTEKKLAAQKKAFEAIEEISQAIARQPNNAELFLSRARNFAVLQNQQAALQDVQIAFSLAPTNEIVLMNGEAILRYTHQIDELIKLTTSLINADKTNYQAYIIRARAKSNSLRDYAGAFEDALITLELNPTEYEIGSILAGLRSLKNDKNILNYYERVFELFERQIKKVEATGARVYVNPEINPSVTENTLASLRSNLRYFMLMCAGVYEEKGEIEKAQKMLAKAVTVEANSRGFAARADYYKQKGKYREALEDLTRAIEYEEEDEKSNPPAFEVFKGESKHKRVGFLISRGDLYVLLKQYDKAIADYDLSVALYEKSDRKQETLEKIAAARQKILEAGASSK